MEEAQNTLDGAQGFLDKVQSIWNGYTNLIGAIPGINGSLEDIIGGLLLAGIMAVIGFLTFGLIGG